MVDINLHQAAEKELRIKKSESIFKSSSFIAFSLLAVVMFIYGATILYQKTLETKKTDLAQMKENELKSIDAEKTNEVVDFQERIDATAANLEAKSNPKDTLDAIERLVVKGVFLNSLVQDGDEGKITMEAVTDSFKTAASQMLSLKKSEMFSDVRILESGRDDSGRVVFSLEADLKK